MIMFSSSQPQNVNPTLAKYIADCEKGFESIPTERKGDLENISAFIQSKVDAEQAIQLIYICTHNSRRSHYGQIWGATAGAYYGVANVETFSGGTEATAFNERAVAACKRAGFEIVNTTNSKNPIYEVRYAADAKPLIAFSKKYDDVANPQKDFCAIMTCTSADAACPVVLGASKRVSTPYEDPKAFDEKPEESAMYDARCKQIATETLYVFSKLSIKKH
jgi:arsenate reductase (thioredoxin)